MLALVVTKRFPHVDYERMIHKLVCLAFQLNVELIACISLFHAKNMHSAQISIDVLDGPTAIAISFAYLLVFWLILSFVVELD